MVLGRKEEKTKQIVIIIIIINIFLWIDRKKPQ